MANSLVRAYTGHGIAGTGEMANEAGSVQIINSSFAQARNGQNPLDIERTMEGCEMPAEAGGQSSRRSIRNERLQDDFASVEAADGSLCNVRRIRSEKMARSEMNTLAAHKANLDRFFRDHSDA